MANLVRVGPWNVTKIVARKSRVRGAVLRHLQPPVPVGVAQVGTLATPVIAVGLHRNAMIARALPRPVAGHVVMIGVGQRRRAVGVPIGHGAMMKPAQRRTPIGRPGWCTASGLFVN